MAKITRNYKSYIKKNRKKYFLSNLITLFNPIRKYFLKKILLKFLEKMEF